MKVFITGSTGFIGYHAAVRLLAEGHEVRALVRDAEKGRRILGPLGLGDEALLVGDMTDAARIEQGIAGCDAVLHAAASVSVTTGAKDFDDNVAGVESVMGAAVRAKVPAVYVSSVTAVMTPGKPIDVDGPVPSSSTHYGRSKARAEQWVRDRQAEGAAISIVYPSGVVGPDDPGFSESVKAYRSFLRGTLQSSGGNQFVDVRDLATLLVRLIETQHVGRVLAAGHFFPWEDFSQLLEQVTGAKIMRIKAPGWVLRRGARLLDVVGRVTGKPMPMTGEGVEIATRWEKIDDSAALEEHGVSWRAPEETLADLFTWFLEVGKLPPAAVPALAPAQSLTAPT